MPPPHPPSPQRCGKSGSLRSVTAPPSHAISAATICAVFYVQSPLVSCNQYWWKGHWTGSQKTWILCDLAANRRCDEGHHFPPLGPGPWGGKGKPCPFTGLDRAFQFTHCDSDGGNFRGESGMGSGKRGPEPPRSQTAAGWWPIAPTELSPHPSVMSADPTS